MSLPGKTVTCTCGNAVEIRDKKDWCDRCGRPVFYHPKDGARHRFNTGYMVVMLTLGIGFVTYLFIEMVVRNLHVLP